MASKFKKTEEQLVTVVSHRRTLTAYSILGQELSVWKAGYRSFHSALFGVAFGAWLTLYVTVDSGQLPPPLIERYTTWLMVAKIAAIYTLLMSIKDWWQAGVEFREIKKTSTPVNIDFSVNQIPGPKP